MILRLLVFISVFGFSFLKLPGQSNCIDIRSFGVVPNSLGDNSDSLQKAFDQAAIQGATLCFPVGVYKFTKPLNISAGVSINGAGMGSNATTTPSNGTMLWYSGDSVALTLQGSNISVSDLTIYNYGGQAKAGVKVKASSKIVESTNLSKVQLYGFTSGTALYLHALSSGGIAYSSFYDVRVRHAKIGVQILEETGSFVNSNSFFHGVISGGGFDYGILINGGNNNVLYSTIIEPPTTLFGHIVVKKGQLIGQNIRIEASTQGSSVPVLNFYPDASQSQISGLYGGGLVINEGNNIIDLASSKTLGENNSSANLLINSGFNLLGVNNLPEYWSCSNSGAKFTLDSSSPIIGQQSIKIKVPAGEIAEFYPKSEFTPKLTSYPFYKYANFSFLVKTDKSNTVKLTYNYSGGLVSSVPHSGSDKWETIGLQALTSTSLEPKPKLYIDNSSGTDSLFVELSSPAFNFGQNLPTRDVGVLNANGGVLTGVLSMSMTDKYSFVSGTTFLIIPKTANTFLIQNSGLTVSRINHLLADRIPKGTIITFLTASAGITFQKSAYLLLKSAYTSAADNTSLTLISNGDGTWREVNRNN